MGGDAPPENRYSLFQDEIIPRLKNRSWFIECIAHNIKFIAARHGNHVRVSARRLGEAHDFWMVDSDRTLKEGMEGGTTELDHFKHASFIAFWIRRMLPINETYHTVDSLADDFDATVVRRFLLSGNELSALLIGFQICLFYEASRVNDAQNIVSIRADRPAYLKGIEFPQHLINDFSMVLKHKNMSPHSLYLMYRSLFAPIFPRR